MMVCERQAPAFGRGCGPPEARPLECPCGSRAPLAPLHRRLLHNQQTATLVLDGPEPRRTLAFTLAGEHMAGRAEVGGRFETVLRPTWRLASVKGGTAKLAAHYETLSFERQAPALLRAVQLGLPVQRCQGGSALKLQRLIDLVKVAVPAMGDPRFWTPWAMPLAVLLSAAAVGEPLRPAKAGTHSEHRCQVHVALLGTGASALMHDASLPAALALAPHSKWISSCDSLCPRASVSADGVVRCEASALQAAADGIALADLTALQPAQRHALQKFVGSTHCDAAGHSQDALLTANTATLWMSYDPASAGKADEPASALLAATIGAAFAKQVDFLVGCSDGAQDAAAHAEFILGITPSDDDDDDDDPRRLAQRSADGRVAQASAITDLRMHLLTASGAAAPVMCAAGLARHGLGRDSCVSDGDWPSSSLEAAPPRWFEPRLARRSPGAMALLQSFYTAARSAAADDRHAEASSALLLTLLRLSMAAARLGLRGTVSERDAMLAVCVAEESQRARAGQAPPTLTAQERGGAQHKDAAEVDFDAHLDALLRSLHDQNAFGETEE